MMSYQKMYGAERRLCVRYCCRPIQLLEIEGETPPKDARTDDPKWFDKRWRYYNILILLCQPDISDISIASRIGLQPGGGQYFREKRNALHALSAILEARERTFAPVQFRQPVVPDDVSGLDLPPTGAMRLTDSRYVERKADVDFQKTAQRTGQTFVIRGARQMGKTSLLRRIAHQLQEQYGARLAYIDFQGIDDEHLASFDTLLLSSGRLHLL